MNLLLMLSLRGLVAFALVALLDAVCARRVRAAGRRGWWLMVPLAFLLAIPAPVLPASKPMPEIQAGAPGLLPMRIYPSAPTMSAEGSFVENALLGLWLFGALVGLGVVLIQTQRAARRWSGERLCTESALLDLLENCKEEAGITAPIGLVVSDRISAPAILGWLRPRILLPRELMAALPRADLRAIFFHELAHFRSLDLPLNWLFTLVRIIHWFNPAAHLAFRAWSRFREEAADETALTWMNASSGIPYGESLLHALRHADGHAAPFGALAIGESIHNLKRRLLMIHDYPVKSPRVILTGTVLLFLALGVIFRPVRADDTSDPRTAAVAAMQSWLTEIDQNQYAQSWTDAAASFQQAVTSDKWVAALDGVRTPLGKCMKRELASAMHQAVVPSSAGLQKGDFVIAQFNSSFENLAYAIETVTFEKAPDGTWKAAGYYIKPKT